MVGVTTTSRERPVTGNEHPVITATTERHEEFGHQMAVANSIKQFAVTVKVGSTGGVRTSVAIDQLVSVHNRSDPHKIVVMPSRLGFILSAESPNRGHKSNRSVALPVVDARGEGLAVAQIDLICFRASRAWFGTGFIKYFSDFKA